MKIIYAGTPEFAVPALQGLMDAGHEIVMVLTQPDRPAGRGMQLKPSPIKQLAVEHGLNVFQPVSLKPEEVQAEIAKLGADVMIVAAYGLIIPTAVLNLFKMGCYNIHGSILPRWRGAAPIHRAILAGDQETGVTIMKVVPALDAGDMIRIYRTPITEQDTTQTLHDKLSSEGARLMVACMNELASTNHLATEAQDESLVTYAHKLEKSEAPIDWQQSAEVLSRQIRAFNPFPVTTAVFKGQVCKLFFAQIAETSTSNSQAGEIISLTNGLKEEGLKDGLIVACGQGALQITELQMPGGKRQTAQQFIQSQQVQLGERFE